MKKVFIVDDDVFLTGLYEKLLRSEGLDVEVANSGEEALERITGFHPDLVVLDLHMPGLHGTDVLRAIRENPDLQHMRVIVFATGYIKTLVNEVADLGVHQVFSKMKCKPRALVAQIKEALADLSRDGASSSRNAVSALESGVGLIKAMGIDQLPVWIERLRGDGRAEARRVCLLHLYRILREEIRYAVGCDGATAEGKLGRALKKLMEDLFDNPQLITASSVDSLEQAIQKMLSLNETKRNGTLESETTLQDLLKGL
ncbi:response regulator [Pontiella sp.]|uniref:response regulator n=1 Tax=Pontiella sp. TaxID=2837462 RepID=UPI003561A2DC